ncbi:MAG TPA: hypothetical protein GXX25_08395 [Desulfotomaculum sp.]|nr:hypothetical protein [Desulfotomaculum sp.]
MCLNELRKAVWDYRRQSNSGARREIIQIVWKHEKAEGLQLMARMLSIDYDTLYKEGDIERFKKQRNRARRQRSGRKTSGEMNARDISGLAIENAGGGTVARYGGKRTKSVHGNGSIKSAAGGQAWDALLGGSR